MGMFDPIQRSAGIQQAFDNLGAQLNFTPPPTFNMNDPASIKKYAQMLMDKGETEKAMQYNQMAQQLEARQSQQADQNVARAYESVRGTPQEEKFKAAMRQAGKGDIIQDIDDKNTQRRVRDIQLENAEDDLAATAVYDDYLRVLNAGDKEGMKLVYDMAVADGSAEKIDAYISKKKQEKMQEVTAKAALLRVKEAEREAKANAIPLPKSPEEYNARLKQAQAQGVEDLYSRRWQDYNEMRKDHEAWKQGEDWAKHKYSREEIEAAGLSYDGYLSTHQSNPKLANDQAADALLKAKSASSSGSEKVGTPTDINFWKENLKELMQPTFEFLGMEYDSEAQDWFDANEVAASTFAANLVKNGKSPQEAIDWIEVFSQDDSIRNYDVQPDGSVKIQRKERKNGRDVLVSYVPLSPAKYQPYKANEDESS
jgi:predicted nucleic acid-binding Zn finger protein